MQKRSVTNGISMPMRSFQLETLSSKSTGFITLVHWTPMAWMRVTNSPQPSEASVGYYYQNGDLNEADGSGVLGRLAYAINSGLTVGTNLSYDNAFKSRFSADIKWRFNTNGGPGKETPKTNAAIEALTSTPSNRDVRVHDWTRRQILEAELYLFWSECIANPWAYPKRVAELCWSL